MNTKTPVKAPTEVSDVKRLGEALLRRLSASNEDKPHRIVLLMYGAPGSGKTTSASILAEYLNSQQHASESINSGRMTESLAEAGIIPSSVYQGLGEKQTEICVYDKTTNVETIPQYKTGVPFATHLKMDGFHLPSSLLSNELARRRGCQESFDASLVVRLCELLISPKYPWSLLGIPDFDHQIKDPVNPGIYVHADTRVVILEGLYLMLDVDPWCDISKLVHVSKDKVESGSTALGCMVQVAHVVGGSVEEMSHRVAQRHFKCGLAGSYDDGLDRYFANDVYNAEVVNESSITTYDDWSIDNSLRVGP